MREQEAEQINNLHIELLKRSTFHHPNCWKSIYDIQSSPCTCEIEYQRDQQILGALGAERDNANKVKVWQAIARDRGETLSRLRAECAALVLQRDGLLQTGAEAVEALEACQREAKLLQEKWKKAEARDVEEYRRLQKKFGRL